ncbi:MAG: DNA polymerase III subunit delta [Clostridia bacterium]|nr:DNA polymerase III subunit delta [Clostridia bacterium]
MDFYTSDDFKRELKKGLHGGYLFFGDEDYLKLNALKNARRAICSDEAFSFFNDLTIEPLKLTADTLLDALTPLPMMSDAKIVSVSGLDFSTFKKPTELEELIEVFASLDEYPSNVLIISVMAGGIDEGYSVKKPSAFLKKLSQYLRPVRFVTPPKGKLAAWCEKHFEHNGVLCSTDVCYELFKRCGTSMFTLASEIDKLSYYTLSKGRDRIDIADVPLVTCSVIEEEAFAFTNALLDGNNEKALEALSVMKFNRVEPVIISAEISKTISDLLVVKSMLLSGKTHIEIASMLRPEPFKLSEYTVELRIAAAASKSIEKLRRALELCEAADKEVKLSGGYAVIEQLLSTI